MANYDSRHIADVVASILPDIRNDFGNCLSRRNPFLSHLKEKGHFTTGDGGTEVQHQWAKQGYTASVNNPYTTEYSTSALKTTGTASHFGTAKFQYVRYVGYYTMSEDDIEKSADKKLQIIDMVKRKLELCLDSIKNKIDADLFQLGDDPSPGYASQTQLQGLPYIISGNPTTGVVGDVDRAVVGNENFRNQAFQSDKRAAIPVGGTPIIYTAATLYEDMRKCWRACDEMTEIIVCGSALWNLYESYLMEQKRYVQTTSRIIGDATFRALEFEGIPVISFKNCPNDKMYFYTYKNLFFNTRKDAFLEPLEPQFIPNSIDKWYPIKATVCLSSNDPSSLGVLTNGWVYNNPA